MRHLRKGKGRGRGEKGAALFVYYSYITTGDVTLLFFLTAVHFKIPGCIPKTRLGYSENKVQKRWTEKPGEKTIMWERTRVTCREGKDYQTLFLKLH